MFDDLRWREYNDDKHVAGAHGMYLIVIPYCATFSKSCFHTSVTSQALVAWSRHDRKAETALPPTNKMLDRRFFGDMMSEVCRADAANMVLEVQREMSPRRSYAAKLVKRKGSGISCALCVHGVLDSGRGQ